MAHGIFGYSEAEGSYFEAVAGWMSRHYGWNVEETWLVKTPGIVFALAQAVREMCIRDRCGLVPQKIGMEKIL